MSIEVVESIIKERYDVDRTDEGIQKYTEQMVREIAERAIELWKSG